MVTPREDAEAGAGQKHRPEGSIASFDEADDMCPNCITPWKCNGPHLGEDENPHPSVWSGLPETRWPAIIPNLQHRCTATRQTETWGLMWCGLYAGHPVVEGEHHWFAEATVAGVKP